MERTEQRGKAVVRPLAALGGWRAGGGVNIPPDTGARTSMGGQRFAAVPVTPNHSEAIRARGVKIRTRGVVEWWGRTVEV